jgi:D-alanine-D-alanine ligase
MGSSVGVSKVRDPSGLAAALDVAFRYDTRVVLERGLEVRELECAVLGNERPEASVLGEVIPSHEFYSYEAKYLDEHGAALEIPARVSEHQAQEARAMAVRAFEALDLAGLARVDFFLEKATGRWYVNEVNTLPGFTRISMYPKLWEASGVSYGALVDRLLALALERHRARRALSTRYAPTP